MERNPPMEAVTMPDRVPSDLGILGPVDDADTIAENIVDLWQSGQAAKIGCRARAHVEKHFSWPRTFAHLFGEIYPQKRIWLA